MKHVKINRKNPDSVALVLRQSPWQGIVDFTSFDLEDFAPIESFLKSCLVDKSPYYIFISSDNVYNVCDGDDSVAKTESDCIRPTDSDLRNRLNEEDDYGDGKLAIEEALHNMSNTIRFVALRMPDVYGPFDGNRFWAYFCWLAVSDQLPVYLSTERELSFVFSEDVAQICVLLLHSKGSISGSFNIQSGDISLRDMLTQMALSGGLPEPLFIVNESENQFCDSFLPSVDFTISDAEIRRLLPAFKATSFESGIERMAQFYRRAWDKYPAQRDEMLEEAFPPEKLKMIRKRIPKVLSKAN